MDLISEIKLEFWIPVLITLIGIISYYFGKIISDARPQQEVSSLNYIGGFWFVMIYFLLPLVVIIQYEKYFLFNLTKFLTGLFILLFFILFTYFKIKSSSFMIIFRGQVQGFFKSKFNVNTNKIMDSIGIRYDKGKLEKWGEKIFFEKPNQGKIIILGFIFTILTINLIFHFENLVIKYFIIFWYLLAMGFVSVLHISKSIKYPLVKVENNNGEIYMGTLLKINEQFIIIRKDREVITIPLSNIKHLIEEEKLSGEKLENLDKKYDLMSERIKKAKGKIVKKSFPSHQ